MRKRKSVDVRSTMSERDEIIKMIDDGMSSKEISEALNVNKMSIAGVMAWHKHPKTFKNVGRKAIY